MDTESQWQETASKSWMLLYPLVCIINFTNLASGSVKYALYAFQIVLMLFILIGLLSIQKLDHKNISKSIIILLLMYLMAVAHGAIVRSITIFEFIYYTIVLILIVMISVFSNTGIRSTDSKNMNYLLDSTCIYVCVCVVMYILGIKPNYVINILDDSSRFADLFGFKTRQVFPFTSSMNTFATIVGISLISSLYRLFADKDSNKFVALIFLVFSLFAGIASDSRGSIIFAFGSFFIAKFLKIRFKYIIGVSVSIFILLISYFNTVKLTNIDLLEFNEKLNYRPVIWLSAINELSTFKIRHVIGYGMYGQKSSSVSSDYAYLFGGYETANLDKISLHNNVLQLIIDSGYLGFLVFASVVVFIIVKLRKCQCRTCTLKLIILIFLLLSGLTEVVPAIYNLTAFLVFLFICATNKHHEPVIPTTTIKQLNPVA